MASPALVAASVDEDGTLSGGGFTSGAYDTSGANFIVVAVQWLTGGSAPTLADSKGNSWTPLTQYGTGPSWTRLFYAQNASCGAGHTFTLSATGFGYPTLVMAAFSGVNASAFDVENGAVNGGGGSTLQPGIVTPGVDNCLVVSSFCFNQGGDYGPGVDSGFSILDTLPSGGAPGSLACLVQTTAAAVNPTWTLSSGVQRVATIAVFRPGLAAVSGTLAVIEIADIAAISGGFAEIISAVLAAVETTDQCMISGIAEGGAPVSATSATFRIDYGWRRGKPYHGINADRQPGPRPAMPQYAQ
jgi:hypothetical protein